MKTKFPKSPYDECHGLVYFPRMLDKIRLHAVGKLPDDYIPNLGKFYDAECCLLFGVEYEAVVATVLAGVDDEEVWKRCCAHGKEPSQQEIKVWNSFFIKGGWRDALSEKLQSRLKESGFEHRTDIQTMFDYIDLDEGRIK